jgi:hypothetical protein
VQFFERRALLGGQVGVGVRRRDAIDRHNLDDLHVGL